MRLYRLKNRGIIVLTGFLQVYFVSVNICFLSLGSVAGVLVASFLVSLIWSINVRKIAFGNNMDRLIYSAAAAVGSVAGLLSAEAISTVFKSIIS